MEEKRRSEESESRNTIHPVRKEAPPLGAGLKKTKVQVGYEAPPELSNGVHLIGQSHIDLSWLWPRTETINEVLPNTYQNALRLMEEYPEFRYTDCSAQFYAWVEEYHPQMFEQIKLRVAEGRWEIVGGTWTQHNATIPCGESIVRQCLFGPRYFNWRMSRSVQKGYNSS